MSDVRSTYFIEGGYAENLVESAAEEPIKFRSTRRMSSGPVGLLNDKMALVRMDALASGRIILHFTAMTMDLRNVSPGGEAIFVAIGALLQAAKGVSALYDAIESLLRKINACLARTRVYLEPLSRPNPALMDILRMALVQVFIVLGIVTKYCDKAGDTESRSKGKKGVKAMMQRMSELYLFHIAVTTKVLRKEDYSRVFLGETDVKEALKELEELTKEEQLIVAANTNAIVRQGAYLACMSPARWSDFLQ
ncbi:hypothetical protein PENSPDRAFT_669265 [Peniophora sp. CONT]|nr:hypothetical protein PENSPDRAFT_669265 [Peniophora sp. CONT]